VQGGGRLLGSRLPVRAREWVVDARRTLLAALAPRVLSLTVRVGLAVQAIVSLAVWLTARAIDLDVAFSVLVSILAPVLIIAAAPVSIGGFGIREGSYAVLLGYAGVSATDATFLSVLGGLAFALASLPGALVPLLRRRSAGEVELGSAGAGGDRTA